jgi:hypothetical protein
MFAARGGFVYFEEAAPAGVPAWQTMSNVEITSEVSTWALTGTRSISNSFALGGTIISTEGAYRSGTLHPNGNIYLPPCTKATNNILEIDVRTSTAREIATGQTLSGAVRFFAGSLGSDGKIYCPPYNYNKVLIMDPANATYTVQDWGLTLTGGLYSAAVTAGDKIYAMGDNDVLIIDVAANTAIQSNYGILGTAAAFRHASAVRSIKDGCVYFGPYANTRIVRIDPVSNTIASGTYGLTIPNQATQGIANGKDGNIYITRHNNLTTNLKIDPVANVGTTVGGTSTKGVGASTGPDGNVYIGAFTNSSWIDVTANTSATSPTFMPNGVQRWGTLYAHGKIWTFPDVTSNTHVVGTTIPSTGASSAWSSNVSLSNYFNRQK